MNTYTFVLLHDAGWTLMKVTSHSVQAARSQIMIAEGCPARAVKLVRKGTYYLNFKMGRDIETVGEYGYNEGGYHAAMKDCEQSNISQGEGTFYVSSRCTKEWRDA